MSQNSGIPISRDTSQEWGVQRNCLWSVEAKDSGASRKGDLGVWPNHLNGCSGLFLFFLSPNTATVWASNLSSYATYKLSPKGLGMWQKQYNQWHAILTDKLYQQLRTETTPRIYATEKPPKSPWRHTPGLPKNTQPWQTTLSSNKSFSPWGLYSWTINETRITLTADFSA